MQQQPSSNWGEQLMEEYKAGASDVEVAAVLNITMATFNMNYKDNLLFKQLVDLGRGLSNAWWHSMGRKNLVNRQFNTALWSFNMKNRFGWAEKSETVMEDRPTDQQSLDEMRSKLLAKMPGIYKRLGLSMTDAQQLLLEEGGEDGVH